MQSALSYKNKKNTHTRTISIAMTITNDIIITLFGEIFFFAFNNPVIKFNYTLFLTNENSVPNSSAPAKNFGEKKKTTKTLKIHLSTSSTDFTDLGIFCTNLKLIQGNSRKKITCRT